MLSYLAYNIVFATVSVVPPTDSHVSAYRDGDELIVHVDPAMKQVTITTNEGDFWAKVGPGKWTCTTKANKGHVFGVICGEDFCRPINADFEIPHQPLTFLDIIKLVVLLMLVACVLGLLANVVSHSLN